MAASRSKEAAVRLRAERERLGLTQENFAALGGVRRAVQYLYERGSRSPSLDYLLRVQDAGVNLAFVLNGSDKDFKPPAQILTETDLLSIVEAAVKIFPADGSNSSSMELRKFVAAAYRAAILRADRRPSIASEPGLATAS